MISASDFALEIVKAAFPGSGVATRLEMIAMLISFFGLRRIDAFEATLLTFLKQVKKLVHASKIVTPSSLTRKRIQNASFVIC
jgi:hypothetical protein